MSGFPEVNPCVPTRRSSRLPALACGLLALAICLSFPLTARADLYPSPVFQATDSQATASSSPLVGSFLEYLSPPGLASRRAMLQIGVVGMCIALYIIVWRK